MNRSPFNVVESKRWERFSPQESGTERDGRSALHLGLDIGPYWLAPLGEHFARSQSQMERAVSNLIIREWGWPPGNGWVEDERQRRKIFKEGEAYASHSSNPRAHDLQFYLAYHAMMIIAGRLLASVPLHRNPDWPEDDFYKWLADHGVTRTDGNWLADRRDPVSSRTTRVGRPRPGRRLAVVRPPERFRRPIDPPRRQAEPLGLVDGCGG